MRFEELLESVADGSSDYGVMAVENTIAGSLNQNLVLLHRNDVHIIGEVSLRIRQTLGALPGQNITEIEEVMSHHMALLQSRAFLSKLNGVRLVEIADTALGAQRIAEQQLRAVGAVGSVRAMQYYGLEVLADEIETNKLNHTRFFVVAAGREATWQREALKSTVHLTLQSRPGSLYGVLGVFYEHGINLTKIESIPIEGQPYHYGFIIDCEFDDQDLLRHALADLGAVTEDLKVLGVYKTSATGTS
jgi:prephenate dehydratase